MDENTQNEFGNIPVEETQTTEQTNSMPESGNDNIVSGAEGKTYDWSKAPDTPKGAPRVSLNGQTVTITKADIMLPRESDPWTKSRAGTSEYKYCLFKIFYDKENQSESYSGMRVFKRMDNGQEKYSDPSMTTDRNNQVSKILGAYADFKQKDINQVTLREFMGFMNSQPKAVIKSESVTNPKSGQAFEKNFIEKFV